MISIIICSIKPQLLLKIKENIKETVGVPYQIIAIDNINTGKGICEVYNQGAKRANYPFLCFVHEDVEFLTSNWGSDVVEHFSKSPKYGVLGIAGSYYKSISPSGWTSAYNNTILMNILYPSNDGSAYVRVLSRKNNDHITSVVSIDGALMFVKKEVFEKYHFDEHTFKDFHCYDIDYCLQVYGYCKVGVIYDIDIMHLSAGVFGKHWALETFKLHRKWKNILPLLEDYKGTFDSKKEEALSKKFFLNVLMKEQFSILPIIRVFLGYKSIKYFHYKQYKIMLRMILNYCSLKKEFDTHI